MGVTTSFAQLVSNKGTFIGLQVLTESNQVAQFQFDRGYRITNFELLWKLGVAGDYNKLKRGFTLTTPSIQFSGKGTYDYFINFALVDELESVVNLGIGTELFINERLSAYLGWSTDFSAVSLPT